MILFHEKEECEVRQIERDGMCTENWHRDKWDGFVGLQRLVCAIALRELQVVIQVQVLIQMQVQVWIQVQVQKQYFYHCCVELDSHGERCRGVEIVPLFVHPPLRLLLHGGMSYK
jgi:hypothetical protein